MNNLQIILSTATTLAAIIAPIVTALISSRSQARMKRIELYQTITYKQYSDFASSYALWRSSRYRDDEKAKFISSIYELAMFVSLPELRQELLALGKDVSVFEYSSSFSDDFLRCQVRKIDERFNSILPRLPVKENI